MNWHWYDTDLNYTKLVTNVVWNQSDLLGSHGALPKILGIIHGKCEILKLLGKIGY